MNGPLFLQKRSRRHMARLLEGFETLVEPHLPPSATGKTDQFKGLAREVIKELTSDGCDVIEATEKGEEINGYAVDMRERVQNGAR